MMKRKNEDLHSLKPDLVLGKPDLVLGKPDFFDLVLIKEDLL